MQDDIQTMVYKSKLLHELQKERSLSSLYLSTGESKELENLKKQRIVTNGYIQNIGYSFNTDLLNGLRVSVDTQAIWSSLVVKTYTTKINNLLLRDILLKDVKSLDQEINKSQKKLIYLMANKEYMGAIKASLSSAFALNEFTLENKIFFIKIFSKYQESLARFNNIKDLHTLSLETPSKKKIIPMINSAMKTDINFNIDPYKWYDVSEKYINELQILENKQVQYLTTLIQKHIDSRFNEIIIFLTSMIFLMIMIVLVTFRVISEIFTITNILNLKSSIINDNLIYSETDLSGKITYASKKFQKNSGYSNSELIGSTHQILRHKDVPSSVYKDMWTTISNDKIWEGEVANRKKDGSKYIVNSTVGPIINKDGKKIGYFSSRYDVTYEKEKDEIIKEQSKFAAMGEMIGMIAHQWRQPLTAIGAIISRLKIQKEIDLLSDEIWDESIQKHSKLIRYMDNIINDFLNFYKTVETSRVKSYDIIYEPYVIIESIFSQYNIKFEINDQFNDILVTSQTKIEQVLINLYKNSTDEMISKDMKNGKVFVKCYKDNDFCIIEISDNAGGIPSDIIKQIFDPYFSTKSKNGTGLGLYMSKVIIQDQLNGQIEVYNEDDGAVFKIALPI